MRPGLPKLLRLVAAGTIFSLSAVPCESTGTADSSLRGLLLDVSSSAPMRIDSAKAAGSNAVVLAISESDSASTVLSASRRIRAKGLALYYWIEVGRNPAMADAHPEWMASLQGHPEWRRLFPNAPKPGEGEVVKNYPWTPILYKEAFEAHLQRIAGLLKGLPKAKGIFLNDLQGPPSACGCGHVLCRWTADYGPLTTATRLGEDAAAKFVASVKKLAPGSDVIPVWTTECEKHDGAKDGACAGVGCYEGLCWLKWTGQLMPLAQQADRIGVLALYKAFDRDKPIYGSAAGWVRQAVASFTEMPPQRKGTGVSHSRIIAVLQGWDVTPEQIKAQVERARESGAAGYVIAETRIDQRWEPRIRRLPELHATARTSRSR